MSRRYPDLINDLAIVQGETYRQLQGGQITLPGNWVDADLRGQIRTGLLEDGGDLLAIFEFDPSTYDSVTDTTTINPYLPQGYTVGLPKTSWKVGQPLKVGKLYVYDLEAEKDGEVKKLFPAFAQVVGEVTDGSVIYNPPIFWSGGIDDIELTDTNGLVKTYTIWGDATKTINLGTFIVTDGEKGDKGDPGDGTDLGAAQIKNLYESNDDTNAFTNAEKTKLGGIQAGAQVNPDLSGYALTSGVASALADKVDKVVGKQLSTEDYTTTEKDKLAGIASGAQVNVKPDWNATPGDANEILNKPTLFSGDYADLSGKPTLGTAAATDTSDYATAAQGAKADTALQKQLAFLVVAVGDETTNLTAGTNKVRFRMPHQMTLTSVRGSVNEAPTGSNLIIDINEGGASILSTKLSIDATELTSTTAATPPVISDSSLADDALISIDIDQVGATLPGKGLKVMFIGEVA